MLGLSRVEIDAIRKVMLNIKTIKTIIENKKLDDLAPFFNSCDPVLIEKYLTETEGNFQKSKDPDYQKEYQRMWHEKNRERMNEKNKIYMEKNKEYFKKWREANKEEIARKQRERNKRKKLDKLNKID